MNIIIRLGKVMTMRVYECSNFLSSPGHQSIDHLLYVKMSCICKEFITTIADNNESKMALL